MKNRIGNALWGILFIVAGVGFAGDAFGIWNFDLFFDGWWTMFIILPCLISLITNGIHLAPSIGLLVGATLLLSAQDILPDGVVWKMIFPAVLVLVGIRIIFHDAFHKQFHKQYCPPAYTSPTTPGSSAENDYIAIFWGRDDRVTGLFEGASVTAIFGGVDLDLRDAVIDHDITIDATAIFGGVDIKLPPNVRVKISSTPIFGGVENRVYEPPVGQIAPVVHINALCTFGGIGLK